MDDQSYKANIPYTIQAELRCKNTIYDGSSKWLVTVELYSPVFNIWQVGTVCIEMGWPEAQVKLLPEIWEMVPQAIKDNKWKEQPKRKEN